MAPGSGPGGHPPGTRWLRWQSAVLMTRMRFCGSTAGSRTQVVLSGERTESNLPRGWGSSGGLTGRPATAIRRGQGHG